MIAVCSLDQVPLFANSSIDHIISIGNADQPRPDIRDFANNFTLHRLVFDDLSSETYPTAPTEKEIKRLFKIFSTFHPDVNILFHCMAGISRSTAAAFLYLMYYNVPYQEAYDFICKIRGTIQPNLLMIKIANQIMNRKGEMLEFVAKASGRSEYLRSSSNI